MRKSWARPVIIGIVALLVLGIGWSVLNAKKNARIAKDRLVNEAVFVEDGRLDSANEGKLVVVTGKLKITKVAYDSKVDMYIPEPKVIRDGFIYDYVVETDDEDENNEIYKFSWTPDSSLKEVLYSDVKVGEFVIDQDIINDMRVSSYFTDAEPGKPGWEWIKDSNTTQGNFLTNDTKPQKTEVTKGKTAINPRKLDSLLEHVGSERLCYRTSDIKGGDTVTFIGIQQGNKLVDDPDFKYTTSFKGKKVKSDFED